MLRIIFLFMFLFSFVWGQQNVLLQDDFEDGELNDPSWYAKFGVPPGSFEVVTDPLDINNKVLKGVGPSYTAHAGFFSQWNVQDEQNFNTHDNTWSYKFMIPSDGASNEFSIAFDIVLDNTTDPTNTVAFGLYDKSGKQEVFASFILEQYWEGPLHSNINFPRDVWMEFNVDHQAGSNYFDYELLNLSTNSIIVSGSTDFFGAPVDQMPGFNEFGLGAEVITAQYFDDVLVTTSGEITPPPTCDLDNGLLAYYPFNGNANDESGNGYDGTNYGASLSADRFGSSASSYLFSSGDYINAGNNDLGGLNNFTVSTWIKIQQADGMIIAADNTPSDRTFYLYAHPNLKIETLIVSDNSPYLMSSQSDIIADNQWHMITLTRRESTAELYIDGILENSQAISGTTNSSNPILIGKRAYSSLQLPFNGNIDDVRIYNRALSQSEIEALYLNNGCPNEPPVASAKNLNVSSGTACTVDISADQFDNGSYDPDGDEITFSVEPSGPYPIGTTEVHFIVTDTGGLSDTAFASITVTGGSADLAGTVSSDYAGLESIIVKLLDNADPTVIIAETSTDASGQY